MVRSVPSRRYGVPGTGRVRGASAVTSEYGIQDVGEVVSTYHYLPKK